MKIKLLNIFLTIFLLVDLILLDMLPELKKDNEIYLFEDYKNKIFKPKNNEILRNPPSRSAKLRYAIRNKNKFFYPLELINKFKKYTDLESLYV